MRTLAASLPSFCLLFLLGCASGSPSPDPNQQGQTDNPDAGAPVDAAKKPTPPARPPEAGIGIPEASLPPQQAQADCVGVTSQQVGIPYDEVCNNYYTSGGTQGNPCTPGGNTCAALRGQEGFTNFCCFKPQPGSYCDQEYSSVPQCVPQ